MKKIFFIFIVSVDVFINASQRKLVVMQKSINRLNVQKPAEIEGYTISYYDSLSIDSSEAGLVELWEDPKIIANAGFFMVVPENQILVVRDKAKPKSVASCIRFGVVDSCGHIDQLATHSDYQGHGLAKKLIQEAEFFCMTQGCSSLKLSVYSDNVAAISCYRKIGFDTCN